MHGDGVAISGANLMRKAWDGTWDGKGKWDRNRLVCMYVCLLAMLHSRLTPSLHGGGAVYKVYKFYDNKNLLEVWGWGFRFLNGVSDGGVRSGREMKEMCCYRKAKKYP